MPEAHLFTVLVPPVDQWLIEHRYRYHLPDKDNLFIPANKVDLVSQTDETTKGFARQHQDGLITKNEMRNKVLDAWTECIADVADAMMKEQQGPYQRGPEPRDFHIEITDAVSGRVEDKHLSGFSNERERSRVPWDDDPPQPVSIEINPSELQRATAMRYQEGRLGYGYRAKREDQTYQHHIYLYLGNDALQNMLTLWTMGVGDTDPQQQLEDAEQLVGAETKRITFGIATLDLADDTPWYDIVSMLL